MILLVSSQMLEKPLEAAVHFARAHELLAQDAWFVEAEPSRLERLKNLSVTKN